MLLPLLLSPLGCYFCCRRAAALFLILANTAANLFAAVAATAAAAFADVAAVAAAAVAVSDAAVAAAAAVVAAPPRKRFKFCGDRAAAAALLP